VDDRKLFKERIEFLDTQIKPGLSKLTWVSNDLQDFLKVCRQQAGVINKVTSLRDNLTIIDCF
jgi:hypothetical protein